MSYRTILVYAGTSPEADRRIAIAVSLAKGFEASLSGISAGFPHPPLYFSGVGPAPDLISVEREEIAADLKAAGEQFAKATDGRGIKAGWQTAIEIPSFAVTRAATAADLVVVGGAGSGAMIDDYRAPGPGDLLMRLGRPLLILPPSAADLKIRRVVVAWKDSREARRAIADSLPFLKQAEVVTLLHIREGQEEDPTVADAKAFLLGHAVEPVVEVADPGKTAAPDYLVDFAKRTQADLIVAGGYGHSRLREWIFGGVTRELLGECPLPRLLSH
jgi:nucleotide-binding universal stress UspA family protein